MPRKSKKTKTRKYMPGGIQASAVLENSCDIKSESDSLEDTTGVTDVHYFESANKYDPLEGTSSRITDHPFEVASRKIEDPLEGTSKMNKNALEFTSKVPEDPLEGKSRVISDPTEAFSMSTKELVEASVDMSAKDASIILAYLKKEEGSLVGVLRYLENEAFRLQVEEITLKSKLRRCEEMALSNDMKGRTPCAKYSEATGYKSGNNKPSIHPVSGMESLNLDPRSNCDEVTEESEEDTDVITLN